MMRTLAIVLAQSLALALAALGWQSWRLDAGRHTIDAQKATLQSQEQALTKKNGQLTSLSLLNETNSRAQSRLYAAAEHTNMLLRQQQRRTEELKRENEELRRWADVALPADLIRLRDRPALTGGAAYREWLSGSDAVSAGESDTAHQRRSE